MQDKLRRGGTHVRYLKLKGFCCQVIFCASEMRCVIGVFSFFVCLFICLFGWTLVLDRIFCRNPHIDQLKTLAENVCTVQKLHLSLNDLNPFSLPCKLCSNALVSTICASKCHFSLNKHDQHSVHIQYLVKHLCVCVSKGPGKINVCFSSPRLHLLGTVKSKIKRFPIVKPLRLISRLLV